MSNYVLTSLGDGVWSHDLRKSGIQLMNDEAWKIPPISRP